MEYQSDSCSALKWEGPLGDFKARLAAGEDVFGELMDKYLLNNKHRVTVITLPDSQLGAQIEAKEQKRIESARSQMSAEDVRCTICFICCGCVFQETKRRCARSFTLRSFHREAGPFKANLQRASCTCGEISGDRQ